MGDPSGADVIVGDNSVTFNGDDVGMGMNMIIASLNESNNPDNDESRRGGTGIEEYVRLGIGAGVGTKDFWGDGGNVIYNGNGYWKTNFIGPGPDSDPRALVDNKGKKLKPLDMLDLAALNHDIDYYEASQGGISGAAKSLEILYADKELVKAAKYIIQHYGTNTLDPITNTKISQRTFNMAKYVYSAFSIIVAEKTVRANFRNAVNGFYNDLILGISIHH